MKARPVSEMTTETGVSALLAKQLEMFVLKSMKINYEIVVLLQLTSQFWRHEHIWAINLQPEAFFMTGTAGFSIGPLFLWPIWATPHWHTKISCNFRLLNCLVPLFDPDAMMVRSSIRATWTIPFYTCPSLKKESSKDRVTLPLMSPQSGCFAILAYLTEFGPLVTKLQRLDRVSMIGMCACVCSPCCFSLDEVRWQLL